MDYQEGAGIVNDDELGSDFLEDAKISETTVLSQAQMALENPSLESNRTNEENTSTEGGRKLNQKYGKGLKATKCREISFRKLKCDKKEISLRGILALANKIVIVDDNNTSLKLFDRNGKFLSYTDLHKKYTSGITFVKDDIFATCGSDQRVCLWTLRDDKIFSEDVTYDLDYWADGIHYNGTYYCILHKDDNAVTVLDEQGRRISKIVMEEAFGKEIMFGFDIHMDSDKHNIYIPCEDDSSGILCMSVEGKTLWFTPLSDADPMGITKIGDNLCTADRDNQCLYLISKTGEYNWKLIDIELSGKPCFIFYDFQNKDLYVNLIVHVREMLAVYYVH